jgi:undecaprenyl-diphosphatase
MDWLYAVILGLIEGLTEFIPVSSTGHLLLAKEAMGLGSTPWDTFIVLIAFVPAVIAGLTLYKYIKQVLFESPAVICWSLIVGGLVLIALERFAKSPRTTDAMNLNWREALGVGLFQCLALVPGVSRSGATIAGGLALGLDKKAAAEFSFFLAIPTMAAAFAKDAWESRHLIHAHDAGLIAVGFVVSFVSGAFVIKTMLTFVEKHGFEPFAWWRILVGAAGLGAIWMGWIG